MKRGIFWIGFAALQIAFVFGKIYQHSYLTNLSYKKQQLTKKLTAQNKKRNTLQVEFFALSSKDGITRYAAEQLNFRNLKLSEIIPIKCGDRQSNL